MDTLAYLELLFNDSANPCYFVDMANHKIIFINKPMEKKLKNFGDYAGKLCYQLIHQKEEPCHFCPMSKIRGGNFVQQSIYNQVTGSYHRANSTLMEIHDTKICACKYFVSVAQDKITSQGITYDKAIAQCVEILNNNKLEASLNKLLALVGQYYQCDRSYIYEIDQENQQIINKYRWLRDKTVHILDEITDKRQVLQCLDWINSCDQQGFVEIDQRTQSVPQDSLEDQILALYQVENLVFFPIRNREQALMGFMGFGNRLNKGWDSRLLLTVARFVKESYSKNIMVTELQAVQYIDDQTGFYNRKRYLEYLSELQESPPATLGILYVHLRDLRNINEKVGLEAGDLYISDSVVLLEDYFMGSFYRISGEEFICFMPNSDQQIFAEQVQVLTDHIDDKESAISLGSAWTNQDIQVLKQVAEASGAAQ